MVGHWDFLRYRSRILVPALVLAAAVLAVGGERPASVAEPIPAASLGIAFVEGSTSTLVIQRDGRNYLVDVAAHSVREIDVPPPVQNTSSSSVAQSQAAPPDQQQTHPDSYVAGDDRLFTLPTGAHVPRHSASVSFTHRFPYEAAFVGVARGHTLLGLDDFSASAFGFQYSVTNRLSVAAYRAPSVIGRPIELMAAYQLAEERLGNPLNATVRFSVDGQNSFSRNFTNNFEVILSRSLTSRAALYLVPTYSYHNRPVISASSALTNPLPYQPCRQALANGLPAFLRIRPCANTVSLGIGFAVDVRPTVALLVETIPTLANGEDLGIHRAPFSFGIQKKIWRHAFTFGFTTAPGTTVAQRAGTRATFLNDANADTPKGLFVGFNLSRQLK